jgi:hypothetical protein
VKNIPLEVEHIIPRTRGGSDCASNLTLACHSCNIRKGTMTATEFGYPEVQISAKRTLKDTAAVNATRWALYRRLAETGLPVEVGTGGRTKWNRRSRNLPKTHWLDAACVGSSTPEALSFGWVTPLFITATGRESRQMCRMDRFGFPRTAAKRARRVFGFQTGDMVRARVPVGTKKGIYIGRVAVRATGSFKITMTHGTIQGVPARFCRKIHRCDGYSYQQGGAALPPLG